MNKKNRVKNLFEPESIEPADAEHRATESSHGEHEQPVTDAALASSDSSDASISPEEVRQEEETGIQEIAQQADLATAADDSAEQDALEDVRRALIEEDASDKSQKESRWWRRFGRKTKPIESEQEALPEEIDLPGVEGLLDLTEATEPPGQTDEEIDQIEDLIQMLESESDVPEVQPSRAPEAEPVQEPEPEIDFDALKKQAFQPRAADEPAELMSDVRSIALEGGEEVLVEVESKPVDPMQERISAFENALKPYRSYLYGALAILGVGMAIVAALILFNVYQQSQPEPVRELPNLPYPTSVSLPGGWSFNLGRGALQPNGRWEPGGPEWLEGTEVCRWVALPWSTQLEAVIRTLNPNDPIELVMSNNDKLTYEVYSIRELTTEEMQQLDSSSPCLLIILTRSDSDKRWVLTALP
jgi:hypothetical protein